MSSYGDKPNDQEKVADDVEKKNVPYIRSILNPGNVQYSAMLKTLKTLPIFIICFLHLSYTETTASDIRLEIDISAFHTIQENYLRRSNLEQLKDLHFTKDRSYNSANVHPSLTFEVNDNVFGHVSGGIYWENPIDKDEEGDPLEADLTAAYLNLKTSALRTNIGLQPISFGNGSIMSNDLWAATLLAERGDTYAEFNAARVLERSPMIGLTLGYRPGFFQHVELFGIWFSDQDDTFAHSLPLVYHAFQDLTSDGDLYWFGGGANVFLGDALLSFVGAYQYGQFQIKGDASRAFKSDVRAYFADIGLDINLSESFALGGFCYLASGDDTPKSNDLEAFVSILPYNSRAIIFFSTAFADNDESDRFTYGSAFHGGVIAPGINLTLSTERGLLAEASLIYLYAAQALNSGEQWYGWETDLTISYTIGEKYRLFMEVARFEHGDYFESLLNEEIDPAMRFVAGVQASF